jgi:hypothetical protein
MYIASDELTLDDLDVRFFLNMLRNGEELSFQSRVNRDTVARAARKLGMIVQKSMIRGQSIDPRYTAEGIGLPDKGLGNDRIYTNLYEIKVLS